jgi:hypothetical protein
MPARFSHALGAIALAVVATVVARPACAQRSDTSTAGTLRSLDSLIADAAAIAGRLPGTQQMVQTALRGQPGNSVGSESAWGAAWGDFFAGGGYQSRGRFSSLPDASASVGFGLGDPRRELGLEVGISSASTFRHTPGQSGSVSLKVHRALPGSYGIAIGVENGASWGGTDGGSSTYMVVSHSMQMRRDPNAFFGSLAWNVGVGNSRFLSQQTLAAGKKGVNGFGSAGIRLAPRVSIIGDWTGQDLDTGLSLVPFRSSPLVLSLGLADVTHHAGDGARFIVGLGAGFHVDNLLGAK